MFPHRKIKKLNSTSPGEKTHKQSDHILIESRWHSNTLDLSGNLNVIRSLSGDYES